MVVLVLIAVAQLLVLVLILQAVREYADDARRGATDKNTISTIERQTIEAMLVAERQARM